MCKKRTLLFQRVFLFFTVLFSWNPSICSHLWKGAQWGDECLAVDFCLITFKHYLESFLPLISGFLPKDKHKLWWAFRSQTPFNMIPLDCSLLFHPWVFCQTLDFFSGILWLNYFNNQGSAWTGAPAVAALLLGYVYVPVILLCKPDHPCFLYLFRFSGSFNWLLFFLCCWWSFQTLVGGWWETVLL